ncbi:MAG: hypothetical protein WC344_04930 [Bacilli bacterium]
MFFKLLKVFLKENFGARRLFGGRVANSKGKIFLFVFLFAYGFISIGFSSAMAFYTLGLKRELLLYIGSYATGLGFLFALFQANGFLFHFKDYEVVGPLPIKPIVLLMAKLTTMMVFIYVITTALCLPLVIVYYMFVPFNIIGFIYLLFGYLVFPLPAIILGSFLSLLIARISKHFAKANLIQTILMFAVFIAIFLVSMLGSVSEEQGSLIPVAIMQEISRFYPPEEWLASAVYDQNHLHFLYLFLSHVGFFTIFLFVLAKLSVKTNQNRTSGKQAIIKSNKRKKMPVFLALLKKEWRRFTGTPIYIFNCGFGLLMMAVMAVAAFIFKSELMAVLGPFGPFALLIAYAFCLITVYTPAINLSLEGNNFALLKTLPIKGETIISAKMMFNLVLEIPVVIVTFPFAVLATELDLWTALSSFLAVISFAVFTSIFFAWLNLFFPRFDFKTEAEIVKQSMSAFIAVFSGMGFLILEGAIVYVLLFIPVQSLALPIALLAIVNALLALALYLPLRKKADVKLQRMEV